MTCDADNVGSATVIERCGGEFESVVVGRTAVLPKRRYWFGGYAVNGRRPEDLGAAVLLRRLADPREVDVAVFAVEPDGSLAAR